MRRGRKEERSEGQRVVERVKRGEKGGRRSDE
jgi:hypothetical protein